MTRVGGEQRREIDFRLICATNRDLKPLVRSGEFREDLYYRINVVHIDVPPLRERHEDIVWLADRFLQSHNEAHSEASRVWGPAARESLVRYPWPSNVRELKHCIERAWVMSRGPALECEDLLSGFESVSSGGRAPDSDLRSYLRGCERARIVEVLERNDWAIGRSAGELGISRKNLWERMRRLEIDRHKAAVRCSLSPCHRRRLHTSSGSFMICLRTSMLSCRTRTMSTHEAGLRLPS